MTDARTVTLDEPLPESAGKVRVVVEVLPAPAPAPESLDEWERKLRERQRARGHVPRTREEIDAELKAERDSWER
jgi:hypothetical protein